MRTAMDSERAVINGNNASTGSSRIDRPRAFDRRMGHPPGPWTRGILRCSTVEMERLLRAQSTRAVRERRLISEQGYPSVDNARTILPSGCVAPEPLDRNPWVASIVPPVMSLRYGCLV